MLKKTLLYNLIFFDFILLEASTNRISNFFLEKIQRNKKILLRLPTFDLIKSFKQMLKLFNFIKKIKKQKKNFVYCWSDSEYIIEFFYSFLRKYQLSCVFLFDLIFPKVKYFNILNSAILFDKVLLKKNFFSFFGKNVWLINSMNYCDNKDYYTYKIFSDLNDYKKLIFLGLVFSSIFKV